MHGKLIRKHKLASYLGTPLVVEGRTIGMLHVLTAQPRVFAPEDVEFFQTLAGQAAIAIRSAGLYEEARRSESKYRTVFDNAGAAMAIIEEDGTISLVNSKAEELFGYSRDELEGKKKWDKFLLKEDLERMMEYHRRRRIDPSAAPRFYESRLIDKTGRVKDVLIAVDMIPETKKSVASVLDITERKQAEVERDKLQTQLVQAQHIAHLGSWDWNIVNNEVRWSDETFRIFGITPGKAKVTYELFLSCIHPDDREHVSQSVNAALYEKKPYDIEHCIVLPDGLERVVHEQAAVTYDDRGQPLQMVGTVHDVTETKQAEAKAREIAGLLANVSHELRTPLTSILGFTSTLLRTDTTWSEEEQRDFLQTVQQESSRLARLIDDLLDMSRLESGAYRLKRDNYDVAQMLKSSSRRLTSLTEHHRLEVKVPEGLPLVFIDEDGIWQVLNNLADNAAKFSPPGNRITIEARPSGDEVIISVTDRGQGIPAASLDRVFDRFYQAESIVSGQKKGTGLGLSISKGIIEAHGGRIWAESQVEKGSRFSFSLPVSKGE